MKVRERCYSGILVDTPMKDIDASHVALATVSHSYYALKRINRLRPYGVTYIMYVNGD